MENVKQIKIKQEGFTLIELIVVIAILGVLAIVAVPRVIGFSDTAKESADQANRSVIKMAAEMHIVDVGEELAKGTYSINDTDSSALNKYFEDETWPEYPLGSEVYAVTISANGKVEITPSILEE